MNPAPASPQPSNADTVALDRAHVFHSWSAQGALKPLVLEGGLGSTVWDNEGNEYLDFSSQLVNVNIGHQHPAVIAGIKAQADIMATVAPAHAINIRGEAARKITDHAPEGMNKVFFTNGGADANENAMRMARLHTGRDKIISPLPLVPRQHRIGRRRHRRLAPHPQRIRSRPRARLRALRVPLRILVGLPRTRSRACAAPPRAHHPS